MKLKFSGREIEARLLRWLLHYYEALAFARPFDAALSEKLACINQIIKKNYY